MINKLFKNRYFLVKTQFLTLTVFVLLIYGAIGIATQDADFAKILRNTNLSNLIVWSYWWPLIIVTAILFGRFWCSICPMELITSFFGKIGLKKKPGRLIKSGWLITLFYAIILIVGIHTFSIHRIPQYMAIYMLVLFIVAVVVGYIWEKRTFCTYICPVGHLLGLYSLLSFKKLRVKDSKVCKNCKTKDCIHENNYYKFIAHSCTSELYPAKISDNRQCILCGQCHKSCPHGNIVIKTRKIGADLFKNIKLTWAEIAFFVIVSGFVIYEIIGEWKVSKSYLMVLPDWTNSTLKISGNLTGSVKAILLFLLCPLVFYLFFSFAKKMFSKEPWKTSFTQLTLAILPVTASMHLLKAFLKTSSRLPYWKYVFSDPQGIETAKLIMHKPGMLNNTALTIISPMVGILGILLAIGGFFLSMMVIKKHAHRNKVSMVLTITATLIYAAIFAIMLISFWITTYLK